MSVSALNHPDAEVRRQSLAILLPSQIDGMLSALLELLDDPDWRVRREVALALGRAQNVYVAISPLLVAVEQGDVARRNAAMEAIRQIGTVVSPVILQRLPLVEPGPRRFLVELLADVGTSQAVEPLEQLLFGDDANVAHAAAESLARIEDISAERALVRALSSHEAVVRLAVLQAFASRKRPLEWSKLEPLLSDMLCRRAALLAAAWCEHPAAIDACVKVLEVGGPIATAAASSLANRASRSEPRVVAALRASEKARLVLENLANNSVNPDARRAAVVCLGLIANPQSVAQVLLALEAPETAGAAESALSNFDARALELALADGTSLGKQATASLLRWAASLNEITHHPALVKIAEQWLDDGGRGAIAWDVIAQYGDEASLTKSVERIVARASYIEPAEISNALATMVARSENAAKILATFAAPSSFGLAVITALAKANRPVDQSALREALTLRDPALRAAALTAMAAIPEASDDVLRLALGDEDPVVQTAAAQGLASRGTGRDVLVASLRAAEPRVRQVAVKAVAQWPQGKELALPLLDDPEASVVLAVLDALASGVHADALITLISHPDADVVSEALARLRTLDRAKAVVVADKLLSHPAWSVRLEAVRSLIHGGHEMRARLEAVRDNEHDELVVEAIDQLLAEQESG